MAEDDEESGSLGVDLMIALGIAPAAYNALWLIVGIAIGYSFFKFENVKKMYNQVREILDRRSRSQ